MAINPVRYDMPGSFIGEIDWSPLARIGETLRKNREEEEAARLIAQLYGSGQQNGPQQNGPQVT
ncbi:hypothetical protein, partial [Bradyrhizobium japonicum]